MRRSTKAEYFREYAEYLRAIARHVRDDKRDVLLGMVDHFEGLANAAETTRSSSITRLLTDISAQPSISTRSAER
jgi:hypothetical protein